MIHSQAFYCRYYEAAVVCTHAAAAQLRNVAFLCMVEMYFPIDAMFGVRATWVVPAWSSPGSGYVNAF
jgi:hypothetical protein